MDVDMTNLQVIDCCVPVGTPSLANDEAEATARVFKALGDPARVKILSLVATADEPVCAWEFTPAQGLGEPARCKSLSLGAPADEAVRAWEFPPGLGLRQATVNHHLKKLTEIGL